MNAPLVARILGLLFLVASVAGLLPWIAPEVPYDAPVVILDAGYRDLFGIWGVLASLRFRAAVFYLRSVVWIYLLIVILGIIPITNTLFGVAPIYGWDIALHLIILLAAAYGGYGRGSLAPETQAPAA